jgi:hypothetical protein
MAPRSVRFSVRLRKLSNVGHSWDGTKNYLKFVPATLTVVSTLQSAQAPRGRL